MDDNHKRLEQHEIAGHTRGSNAIEGDAPGDDRNLARTNGPRRDSAKERLWRRCLAEQQQSVLSVRAYCRCGGISEASFYWWRGEIARRDAETRVRENGRSARKGFANNREDLSASNKRKDLPTGDMRERGRTPREGAHSKRAALHPPLKVSQTGTGALCAPPAFVELHPTNNLAVTAPSSRSLEHFSSSVTDAREFSSQAAAAARAPLAEHAIEIILRNGRGLRVRRGFDPDLLLELAAVLESKAGPC